MSDPSKSVPIDRAASGFYRAAMHALNGALLPFLVGGAHALQKYAGITRRKDFDIFVLPSDVRRALTVLEAVADRTDLRYPHWLGKAQSGPFVIDLIFDSGNGICRVDQGWFDHAPQDCVLDVAVHLVPAEELIWQKAFVMERHRFDGGDVLHLLHARAAEMDWNRLVNRFGANGMVLLSHLDLLHYVYPDSWSQALEDVVNRLRKEPAFQPLRTSCGNGRPLCRGTLLSLLEYLPDIDSGAYRDARLPPYGRMTAAEIAQWTATFER